MIEQKLKTRSELKDIIRELQAQGKKIVLANGCFDILHGGHISYLEAAKAAGDILVVAVNSDSSVRQLKDSRRPIIPENERVELLSYIEFIDYIVVFDEQTCDNLLRELRPNFHAKGTDYTVETVPERATARELEIETIIVGDAKENATKDIIAEIIKRFG